MGNSHEENREPRRYGVPVLGLPVKFAADCRPCDSCAEPYCDECGEHYADCEHPGPDSGIEDVGNIISRNWETLRVLAAIEATPRDWLRVTLAQRSAFSDTCAGSRINAEPEKIDYWLRCVAWESYDHPDIKKPGVGFITRGIGGCVGIADLATVPPDTLLTADDRKDTGYGSLIIARTIFPEVRQFVRHTVAILGPGDDDKEILWTFHPGDPIPPSEIRMEEMPEHLTAGEALERGLRYAKVE